MVLASLPYDEQDYIRDRDAFTAYRQEAPECLGPAE